MTGPGGLVNLPRVPRDRSLTRPLPAGKIQAKSPVLAPAAIGFPVVDTSVGRIGPAFNLRTRESLPSDLTPARRTYRPIDQTCPHYQPTWFPSPTSWRSRDRRTGRARPTALGPRRWSAGQWSPCSPVVASPCSVSTRTSTEVAMWSVGTGNIGYSVNRHATGPTRSRSSSSCRNRTSPCSWRPSRSVGKGANHVVTDG
jgi:hypothetical protein